jgi:glyoxylase-like metal-dependent hydrolase (beta-lactamase superfamily II)
LGRRRLIIDTSQGYRAWADLIDDTLEDQNVELSHVLLTHWHGDHTGGVPDLIRMYPHVEGAIYKNDPEAGQLPIEEGDIFTVDEETTIEAVHAPGHSHDHMCFILKEENAMFTGDNVLGHGTSAIEDLGVYMGMLRKLLLYNCITGYPAHGEVIKDLPAKINSEIAQKTRREKMCLSALKRIAGERRRVGENGSVTVKELVTAMHGKDLDREVRELALEPLMGEVLRRLAQEGKVGFQARRGVLKWFLVENV